MNLTEPDIKIQDSLSKVFLDILKATRRQNCAVIVSPEKGNYVLDEES